MTEAEYALVVRLSKLRVATSLVADALTHLADDEFRELSEAVRCINRQINRDYKTLHDVKTPT